MIKKILTTMCLATVLSIGFVLPASADRIVDIYNNGPLIVTHEGCDRTHQICAQIQFDLSRTKFSPRWAYKAAEALLDFYPVQALSLELAEYFHGGAKTAAKSGLALKIEGIIIRAKKAGASSVLISVPDWHYSY